MIQHTKQKAVLSPHASEHAYHLGWNAYFDDDKHNPYDKNVNNVLYERYENGFKNAHNSDHI